MVLTLFYLALQELELLPMKRPNPSLGPRVLSVPWRMSGHQTAEPGGQR